jgi:polysaccharide pyruvyl transferase WcaK-like protein
VKQRHIVHLGAWDRNHGDRAIQLSLKQNYERIAEAQGVQLTFEYVAIPQTRRHDRSGEGTAADDPPALDAATIEAINQRADLLLIGGGGLIMNRSTGPFQIQAAPEAWDRLEIPVVFQSIGWNQFPYDDPIDENWLRDNLFEPLRRRRSATLISVRNSGTYERVHPLYPDLRLVPDPGFFIEADEADLPGHGPRIGLCWSSDRLHKRWPSKAAEDHFLDGIIRACRKAADEFGAMTWLIPHIKGLDAEIASVLQRRLGDSFANLEDVRPDLYPATLSNARSFVGCYKAMDAVLGMRKHSVIIPIGLGIPALGLGDQAEVRWMLEDLDFGDRLLPSGSDAERGASSFLAEALRGKRDARDVLKDGRLLFDTFIGDALRLVAGDQGHGQ